MFTLCLDQDFRAIKKALKINAKTLIFNTLCSRADKILTCDPLPPRQVRYQTALQPFIGFELRVLSLGQLKIRNSKPKT